MWDTADTNTYRISHDMPCQRCGHAMHTYLACDDSCGCQPARTPVTTATLVA